MVPGNSRTDPGMWLDRRSGAYSRGRSTATRRAREGTGGIAVDCREGLCEAGAQSKR